MKGNSSAHQARPMIGTQINSFFRKNLSSGIRRFSTCCSTRISTQLWWLHTTRYHWRGLKGCKPLTSQSSFWVRRIQKLLPAIQASAMRSSSGSIKSRTALKGSSSLTIDTASRIGTHSRMLSSMSRPARAPRRGGGKKWSMVAEILGRRLCAGAVFSGMISLFVRPFFEEGAQR